MTGSGPPETTPAEANKASAERTARPILVSSENLLNPFPLYKELRESEPVHWSDEVGAWFIVRHDDVINCFRDSRLTSDRAELFDQVMQGLGADVGREFGDFNRRMMINRDGPSHLSLRRQASAAFTPQILDTYVPMVRHTMGMLLDRVQHLERMDLVTEISNQLPPLTLSEFLGLPLGDHERILEWAKPLSELFSPKPGSDMKELTRKANASTISLSNYLDAIIDERRQNPGQDTISRMLHAQQAGKMSQQELAANVFLLVSAGHTTTTDQLSNGIYALLTHPDQLRLLRQDMSLVRSAVEEMLRFNPAVPFTFRIAVTDIQLRGRTIRKGDRVFLGIAAANRDPAIFTDPDRFDITRDNIQQKHISFAFGPHHCLGAGLARRQLELATEMLLQRLPGLRLDETRQPQLKILGLSFRGFESLPVCW
jgi:cytochrome P450 PksS